MLFSCITIKDVLSFSVQNLTVTRLPVAGVCYIKPLDEMLTSSSKMKTDMTHVSSINHRDYK